MFKIFITKNIRMDKYSIEKSEPMLQKSAALPRWSVLFLGNSAATRDITTQYIVIQQSVLG